LDHERVREGRWQLELPEVMKTGVPFKIRGRRRLREAKGDEHTFNTAQRGLQQREEKKMTLGK